MEWKDNKINEDEKVTGMLSLMMKQQYKKDEQFHCQ